MSASEQAEWRNWVWAGGSGVALVSAVWLMSQMAVIELPVRSDIPDSARGGLEVGLARLDGRAADQVLSEEASMRDPAPLFLPSAWSASADVLPPEAWREPGATFRSFEPKLLFPETDLALSLQVEGDAPTRAADVFALEQSRRLFVGFGETGEAPPKVTERAAFVEVISAADGQRLIAEPLAEARPPGDAPWQPLEILLAVDRGGVVRPPVLVESSRVAAVDVYFQDYVLNVLHLGERLGPGFYRVGIGP